MTESRVAIIGAGFAGLAACWAFLQQSGCRVTLFDALEIGSGTSGTSAGLLHPFTGPEARVPVDGLAAFAASQALIATVAAEFPSVILAKGILRLALSERQELAFRERSEQYPGLRLLSPSATQKLVPGLVSATGLWIEEGLVIDSQSYLQGLWQICARQGAHLVREQVTELAQLKDYDQIIVACGSASMQFPELAHLSMRRLKGQIIELSWPRELPPLKVPLNGDVYILPSTDGQSVIVGATFEHTFASEQPDPAVAEAYLRPRAERLIPALRDAQLLGCRAGVRATVPSRFPIAGHIKDNIWALTALGSKGLLYHALLAQRCVAEF